VKALNLAEGERVLLSVAGGTLVLESLQDPIQLALSGKKFASVTAKQVEEISLEQQRGHAKSSP
jgi:predicted DNA-binding antitoxin AbrB/MazE fold protein